MIKLPSGLEINNLIKDFRVICWEAADILLFYSQMLKDSNNKSEIIRSNNNEDPVTIADLKVNKMIFHKIKEKFEDIDWEILSEENVKIESNYCNTSADWLWVLDPLDGTKDFIQGTGNYAMHLALNYKQKPHLGFVLIPEKSELWITSGEKTWCERRDGRIVEPKLSEHIIFNEMILVTSKNHKNETLKKLIDKCNFKKVLEMGSIGCKVASIIRGESDIYISLSLPGQSSPKDWDFAAPEVILKAAGGSMTYINNNNLSYNQENFDQRGIIIATNNKLNHQNICVQLKDIIRKNDIYPFLY